MKDWCVQHKGKIVGPIASKDLKRLASEQKISPETMLRLRNDGEWTRATKVKGLFAEEVVVETGASTKTTDSRNGTVEVRTQVIAQEVLLEKPVDKAPCPFCGEQILLTAIKCRFCNEFLDKQLSTTIAPQVLPPSLPSPQPIIQNVIHNTVVSTHAPRWNPGVAAILSFIIPGLGEMYKGQVLNGIIWLFLTTIGYVCFIVPGLVLHVCCIVGAASGNPNR